MANPRFSDFGESERAAGKPSRQAPGPRGDFREKPAFPSAGLPGKTQPKDRSAGMGRKAKTNPKSEGI